MSIESRSPIAPIRAVVVICIALIPWALIAIWSLTSGLNDLQQKLGFPIPMAKYWGLLSALLGLAASITLFVLSARPLRKAVLNELLNMFDMMHQPLSMGLIIGFGATLIYYGVDVSTNGSTHNFVACFIEPLGVFATTSGLFVAVHSLYKQYYPITTMDQFLKQLTSDLSGYAKREPTRFIFYYPGPALGSLSGNHELYESFKTAFKHLLQEKLKQRDQHWMFCWDGYTIAATYLEWFESKPNIEAENSKKLREIFPQGGKAILKDIQGVDIAALKEAVEQSSRNGNDNAQQTDLVDRVANALYDTIDLMRLMRRHMKPGHFLQINRNAKREVIVLDDIVYLIESFGMPTGHEKANEGKGEIPHVDIIATRIESSLLANQLVAELIQEKDKQGLKYHPEAL
ncbi:MAG: hypothetical protein H6507_12180 [Calditrichaeota bacterium]|nr:hypothetical protein [Calditrichota bacterium]